MLNALSDKATLPNLERHGLPRSRRHGYPSLVASAVHLRNTIHPYHSRGGSDSSKPVYREKRVRPRRRLIVIRVSIVGMEHKEFGA